MVFMCVSFKFIGFFLPPKNRAVGLLLRQIAFGRNKYVNVCVVPIHDALPGHAQCSQKRIWIRGDPEQAKAVTKCKQVGVKFTVAQS